VRFHQLWERIVNGTTGQMLQSMNIRNISTPHACTQHYEYRCLSTRRYVGEGGRSSGGLALDYYPKYARRAARGHTHTIRPNTPPPCIPPASSRLQPSLGHAHRQRDSHPKDAEGCSARGYILLCQTLCSLRRLPPCISRGGMETSLSLREMLVVPTARGIRGVNGEPVTRRIFVFQWLHPGQTTRFDGRKVSVSLSHCG
jgi:hypothetical protein